MIIYISAIFDFQCYSFGDFVGESFKVFRRQEIEELYFFEGSVYVSDVQILLKKKSFCHDRTLPFIMPRWKSLEIDERVDILTAETIIKNISQFSKDDNGK